MFWKRKSKAQEDATKIAGIEHPEIGSRWIQIAKDGNPWGEARCEFIEIFDTKNEWVRFGRRLPGEGYTDNKLPLVLFLACYQKYVPIPDEHS
jgi:hypothetical protein